MENWIQSKQEKNNIVISSRIRLARNIKEIPFPYKVNEEKGREVVKIIEDAFYTSSHMETNFATIYMWQDEEFRNKSYFEKHLISKKLVSNSSKAAFIVNAEETVSVMINEEDHIRIQCITGGFNLKEAYDVANKLDDLLEEKLNFSFDERIGYLTACPTNIGTGLRASVMMHLPGLTMNNQMNQVLKAVSQVGMTIRGLYGEGSEAQGNIYQISNQITLGVSEEEILANLSAVVNQIQHQEKQSREMIMEQYRYELEDKIYRSLGILKSAILLGSKECLNLLSNVRMGIEMDIISDMDKNIVNTLLVEAQEASLQTIEGQKLSEKEADYKRAKLVREKLI